MLLTSVSDLFKKALHEDKHNGLHCHLGKETVCHFVETFSGRVGQFRI